jgi:hypothetical protein
MAHTAVMWPGDTPDYARSIELGSPAKDPTFIDFGHLYWRPLGLVVYRAAGPLVRGPSGSDPRPEICATLAAINWIAGLACVLALARILNRLGVGGWPFWLTLIGFCSSFGFLNYAHSGSSYIPALAMLMLGLATLVPPGPVPAWRALLAGAFAALAVGFWATFVLAVPMLVVYPLLGGLSNRRAWRSSALVAAGVIAVGFASFATGALAQRVHDVEGLKAWIKDSAHGITRIGGIARSLFGFPRSFVAMGHDGVLFKRYLVKDPYAPVSLASLIGVGVLKLGLFYLALGVSAVRLVQDVVGRRTLAALMLTAVPVLGFAIYWQGGDAERYLALYPLLFAAWGLCLSNPARFAWAVRLPVMALMVLMAVINVPILSVSARDARSAAMARRAGEFLTTDGPKRRVFVVDQNDDLLKLGQEMSADTRRRSLASGIIMLGYDETPRWREGFARRAAHLWDQGAEVWVSRRALADRPDPSWRWVEGDDLRVKWKDLPQFFGSLEYGRTVGGEDGFLLLPRSQANQRRLGIPAAPPAAGSATSVDRPGE